MMCMFSAYFFHISNWDFTGVSARDKSSKSNVSRKGI